MRAVVQMIGGGGDVESTEEDGGVGGEWSRVTQQVG